MSDYVFCDECEESCACPDACRMDGCECGLKTKEEEEENERSE